GVVPGPGQHHRRQGVREAAQQPAEPVAELAPAEPVVAVAAETAEAPAQVEAAPAPAPAPAPVAAAPAPVAPAADLNELLGAAGLTLAATDPAKLRAAQEAAASQPAPVRVRRERKPLPPPVDEPLIQVDTRQ
ncbi:MAG: ribonuclease E/G, partial [Gammaproteobacteria bacterium]